MRVHRGLPGRIRLLLILPEIQVGGLWRCLQELVMLSALHALWPCLAPNPNRKVTSMGGFELFLLTLGSRCTIAEIKIHFNMIQDANLSDEA